MATELPLFPLNIVLFPGTQLPLHIFEMRYRLMINECYERKQPFGLVLARPESETLREEPYPIGTMAEIEVLERMDDGRMNLIAKGGQRFRILSQHRQKPYLSGRVEPYSDVAEPEQALNSTFQQARALFQSYLETLLEVLKRGERAFTLPDNAEELSFFIAHLMDLGDEQKQHMLELTSTSERLGEEIALLRRELPFMRAMLSRSQHFHADTPDRSSLN